MSRTNRTHRIKAEKKRLASPSSPGVGVPAFRVMNLLEVKYDHKTNSWNSKKELVGKTGFLGTRQVQQKSCLCKGCQEPCALRPPMDPDALKTLFQVNLCL